MILTTAQEEQHVDDGDLIRLRDGECPLSEERKLRQHLEDCATCKENSERIEWLADGFVSAVEGMKTPVTAPLPKHRATRKYAARRSTTRPLAWNGRRSVRLAAVIVAALAITMTAAPARALVVAGWDAVKTLFVGAPLAVPEVQQATSLVSFVPQGEAFLIDFLHTQSEGTLSVVIDTVTSATARVLGGDGLDELVVLQAGLRIRNRTVSSPSYELRLPQFLQDIEVRVAGRTVAAFSTSGLTGGARWVVDLTNPGGG